PDARGLVCQCSVRPATRPFDACSIPAFESTRPLREPPAAGLATRGRGVAAAHAGAALAAVTPTRQKKRPTASERSRRVSFGIRRGSDRSIAEDAVAVIACRVGVLGGGIDCFGVALLGSLGQFQRCLIQIFRPL